MKENILIVDDHLQNLDLIIEILDDQGYEVRSATTGRTALQAVEAQYPDLILLDIEMPGMDGYEVCQQLKDDPLTQDIPIIFISVSDEILDKVKAFSVGGADYITKPFHIEEMLARIKTHLAIRRLTKTLEEKNKRLNREIAKRKAYEKKLKYLAITDSLTQIYNRRHFFELADQKLKRAKKNQDPISIIMIDIDRFKNVNDTHGHLVGDKVLARLAKFCSSKIRDKDIFARYGGEEFVILMPNTSTQTAAEIGEELRQSVYETPMTTQQADVSITISLGVTTWDCKGKPDIERLLDKADKALYRSKELGRNQITVWKDKRLVDSIRSLIDHLN